MTPVKVNTYRSVLFYPIKHPWWSFLRGTVFFQSGFFSRRHWQFTGKKEKGGVISLSLSHFHPLTNIQTLICNFASEITTTYFQSQCMQLPDWLLLDVIFLPLEISIWLNFNWIWLNCFMLRYWCYIFLQKF